MLKVLIAVLAVGIVGTASAAGWRDLRVDASSEEAFAKSLEAFQDRLSRARRYVFGEALKDIWIQGAKAAEAGQREYTTDEYYRQLHGLRYEEVVRLTDPTGDTAKDRYRTASLSQRYSGPAMAAHRGTADVGSPPIGWSGQQVRGATQQDMLPRGCSAGCGQ